MRPHHSLPLRFQMHRMLFSSPLPNPPVPPPHRSWSAPRGLRVPRFSHSVETSGRVEVGVRGRVLCLVEPWEPHQRIQSGSTKRWALLPPRPERGCRQMGLMKDEDSGRESVRTT